MTFPFPVFCPAAPVKISHVNHSFSAVDGASRTFSGVVPGDAGFYVVAVGSQQSGTPSISSITARGVAMTLIETVTSTNTRISLYGVNLPAGSAGDVAITFSASQVRCGVDIWKLENLQSTTATATANDNTNPLSQSLAVHAGGVAVGFAVNATNGSTISWSGLAPDGTTEPGESSYVSLGASIGPIDAQTLAITATPTTFSLGVMVLAAFR